MGRLVQKFGGTALPDIESIKKAAEIAIRAAEEGNEITAVVTSIGKTSDQLRSLAENVAGSPNARDLDMLLASAEQASAALFSMAIQSLGWPARSFTAAQAGIVTESRHGNAPIREICTDEIENSLERGEIAVVAGFQGITETHEVTTVGDGGVDAAAIALTCSLEAERCDVYSQNEGVCTADPRIVSEARLLAAISYEEMLELSPVCRTCTRKRLNWQWTIACRSEFAQSIIMKSSAPLLPTNSWCLITRYAPSLLTKIKLRCQLRYTPPVVTISPLKVLVRSLPGWTS
jgi:aspartate kinase